MTTSREILAHHWLCIGTATKSGIIAAWNAADDEGTIQATDALRLFGTSRPCLHTTMSLRTALRHLGCVEID